MNELVLLEKKGAVAVLTLNRPERHNSLVPELLRALLGALDAARQWSGLRAGVLQANGRSFSTGGEVRGFYEHKDRLPAYADELVGLLNQAILALLDFPVPIVAAVHGIVTGGSLGLVLASDIVLVAPQTSFTPYYTTVGYSPDGGWTALLPTLIGPKRATEVLLLNQTITADQAVAWRLAQRIVPAEEIRRTALAIAQTIAAQPPGTVRRTKHLLRIGYAEVAARLEEERRQFVQQIATTEAWEGTVAFVERRVRS